MDTDHRRAKRSLKKSKNTLKGKQRNQLAANKLPWDTCQRKSKIIVGATETERGLRCWYWGASVGVKAKGWDRECPRVSARGIVGIKRPGREAESCWRALEQWGQAIKIKNYWFKFHCWAARVPHRPALGSTGFSALVAIRAQGIAEPTQDWRHPFGRPTAVKEKPGDVQFAEHRDPEERKGVFGRGERPSQGKGGCAGGGSHWDPACDRNGIAQGQGTGQT